MEQTRTALQQSLRPCDRIVSSSYAVLMKKNDRQAWRRRYLFFVQPTASSAGGGGGGGGAYHMAAVLLVKRRSQTTIAIECVLPIAPSWSTAILETTSSGGVKVALDPGDDVRSNTLAADSLPLLRAEVEMSSMHVLQSFLNEARSFQTQASDAASEKRTLDCGWIQLYLAPSTPTSPTHKHGIDDVECDDLSSKNSKVDNPFVPAMHEQVSNISLASKNSDHTLLGNSSPQAIKQSWVQQQLKRRQNEFTDFQSIRLWTGTWNVNGKLTTTESLAPWFTSMSLPSEPSAYPDIIAVGFQEMDLSAEAFLLNDSTRTDEWMERINRSLPKSPQYVHLISKHLVGLFVTVFIRSSLLPFVTSVASDSAGCGIMGMMGNKGGVAVRIGIMDGAIVIVNSHLAADSKEVVRRNQDYAEIVRRVSFEVPSKDGATMEYASIWDSDHLIWMGDLNYRIPLPESDVKQMLSSKKISEILQHDQLNAERKAKRVFQEFDEGEITFPPTYKYDAGTSNFDSSEKKRAPAWCDRILWRKGDRLDLLTYTSSMEMFTSDHKPVSALFSLQIKRILEQKKNEVHQSILRDLDKFENESIPDVRVSTNLVEFGEVRYGQPTTTSVVLENIGQVVAQYRFIPKLDDKHFCKPWLWINPPMSMLLPGEKLKIKLTVLVDDSCVTALNTGDDSVEDILILHIENGKDHFISVSGKYIVTCFGVSLETLSRLSAPIRTVGHNVKLDEQAPASLSVPKELWRLIDYIYKNGLTMENLFLSSGDGALVSTLQECLDTGSDFPSPSSTCSKESIVRAVSETLLRFLNALPVPVIPYTAYQKCLDSCSSHELAHQAVSGLPTIHHNTFVYLTSFLKEVSVAQCGSELTREKIAMIFSAVMMRSTKAVAEKYADAVARKKASFLMHFI